jgi:hypothetical protein
MLLDKNITSRPRSTDTRRAATEVTRWVMKQSLQVCTCTLPTYGRSRQKLTVYSLLNEHRRCIPSPESWRLTTKINLDLCLDSHSQSASRVGRAVATV